MFCSPLLPESNCRQSSILRKPPLTVVSNHVSVSSQVDADGGGGDPAVITGGGEHSVPKRLLIDPALRTTFRDLTSERDAWEREQMKAKEDARNAPVDDGDRWL